MLAAILWHSVGHRWIRLAWRTEKRFARGLCTKTANCTLDKIFARRNANTRVDVRRATTRETVVAMEGTTTTTTKKAKRTIVNRARAILWFDSQTYRKCILRANRTVIRIDNKMRCELFFFYEIYVLNGLIKCCLATNLHQIMSINFEMVWPQENHNALRVYICRLPNGGY